MGRTRREETAEGHIWNRQSSKSCNSLDSFSRSRKLSAMSRRYLSFKITVQFGLALTKPRRTTFVQFQTAYEVRPATRTKCIRRGPHGGQSVDSTARVRSTWDAESEQIPSCHRSPTLKLSFWPRQNGDRYWLRGRRGRGGPRRGRPGDRPGRCRGGRCRERLGRDRGCRPWRAAWRKRRRWPGRWRRGGAGGGGGGDRKSG